jgi:hypothetical protein
MDILRKLLTTYVNVGTTLVPEWKLMGYKIEDAAIELNPETEKVTDILGITHTEILKIAPQMSLSTFRLEQDDPLAEALYEAYKTGNLEAFSNFEVMNVFGWKQGGVDPTFTYEAEVHSNCTLELESIGGSGRITMPVNIHFSEDKVLGTTNTIVGTTSTPIVFTPSV